MHECDRGRVAKVLDGRSIGSRVLQQISSRAVGARRERTASQGRSGRIDLRLLTEGRRVVVKRCVDESDSIDLELKRVSFRPIPCVAIDEVERDGVFSRSLGGQS